MKTWLVAFTCLVFTACTSVPIMSIPKLLSLDPLTADPAQIQVAVLTSDVVKFNPESVKLTIGFDAEETKYDLEEVFFLVQHPIMTPLEITHDINEAQSVTVFKLSSFDIKAIAKIQQSVAEIKQKDIKGKGMFGVQIDSGCLLGSLPNKLLASVYLKVNTDDAFFAIADQVDLAEVDPNNPKPLQNWPKC